MSNKDALPRMGSHEDCVVHRSDDHNITSGESGEDGSDGGAGQGNGAAGAVEDTPERAAKRPIVGKSQTVIMTDWTMPETQQKCMVEENNSDERDHSANEGGTRQAQIVKRSVMVRNIWCPFPLCKNKF